MARHLFFTGEKGVGKTTLLKGLLAQYQGPVGGFFTLKTTGVRPGRYTVHLLRPNQGEKPREENLLFCCGDPVDSHIAARFDGLGCAALAAKEDAGLLVMDEIGPHEQGAQGFCKAVFQALDGETPILGVLQRADTPPVCPDRQPSPGAPGGGDPGKSGRAGPYAHLPAPRRDRLSRAKGEKQAVTNQTSKTTRRSRVAHNRLRLSQGRVPSVPRQGSSAIPSGRPKIGAHRDRRL